MDLLLGATEDPVEGRAQHDHAAPPGRTGAFPLHAVRPGTERGLCGAPVRLLVDGSWPPGIETRCTACEKVVDEAGEGADLGDRSGPPDHTPDLGGVSPHGEP